MADPLGLVVAQTGSYMRDFACPKIIQFIPPLLGFWKHESAKLFGIRFCMSPDILDRFKNPDDGKLFDKAPPFKVETLKHLAQGHKLTGSIASI